MYKRQKYVLSDNVLPILQWVPSGLHDDNAGKETEIYTTEVAVGGPVSELCPAGVLCMPLALFVWSVNS